MRLRAGATTEACVLELVDDLQREADETMTVLISNVTVVPGGTPGTAVLGVNVSTEITITDNDCTYSFGV